MIGIAGAAGGWALAAVEGEGTLEFVIPAAALTATASAFVWLVGLLASGKLVHRDSATATADLARALERSNLIAEEAMSREDRLLDILTKGTR